MDKHKEIYKTRLEEKEKSEVKSNSNISNKIGYKREEEEDTKNNSFCSIVKQYQRYDLLSLRNSHLSIHYPHCALRPELQALPIWTCRLRCELQYLNLWKIPNTGNSYSNCTCNGSCQLYACDRQHYLSTTVPVNTLNSQMCYGSVQQSQQQQPLQTNSSPTVSTKKAARSRERFLNYQRCINTELIRTTSPSAGGGCGGGEGLLEYHLSHQIKPAFIDHRSISSSHLMPAFAKRRMGHANVLHGQLAAGSYVSSNGGHKTEQLSNDDGVCKVSNHYEASVKSRHDTVKAASNQNDYHLYKTSGNNRLEKNDQLIDNKSGWINLVKKINNDFPPPNSKVNNAGSVNKKLIYERRIGSGRLVPREAAWDMRIVSNKHIEKENVNSSLEKGKDVSTGEEDKLHSRNSLIGRYSDPRTKERRIFDRHVSNSEDSKNSGNNTVNKRYSTTSLVEVKNNFDSNYHSQTPHYAGQRSMSFRRREYVEHKDNHRDFRDFRESKDSREDRGNKEQKVDQLQHHNTNHRDHKAEPEWFIEGPTSQHDIIELRGFEETDESQLKLDQTSSSKYSKTERQSSESSLLSHQSSNLSAKDNFDIYSSAPPITNNRTNAQDSNNENSSNNTPKKETTDVNELKTEMQVVPKSEEFKNPNKGLSNGSELFFDNILNIEALENTLIGSGNEQPMMSTNDGGGTSRFSRWFIGSSSNNQSKNDELNNNPPKNDDPERLSKDMNESDFNSFMSFLKCNNFPTPELPKALPSNVSALSVEELEARMRKMDSSEDEKINSGNGIKNLPKNNPNQTEKSECESKSNHSQSIEINTQDVEAFRKLLDQLGKPRDDISMNIIFPNTQGQSLPLTTHGVAYPTRISPMPLSRSLTQSNMSKQEYMTKIMHQQQNVGKVATPLLQHHHPHHRITQMSPQQADMSLMSVPHHTNHMTTILGNTQRRLDVQYLIQSVVREELSRSFLEKELNNPNIPPYTKEIISTVLKETARYTHTLAGCPHTPDSTEISAHIDISATPSNLMQSLARGEVSLNLLEHELNKLNNINIVNGSSAIGTLKASSIKVVSIPTSGNVTAPIPSQAVPVQKQNLVLKNESSSSDQQVDQQGFPMLRLHHHEDTTLHLPTQRELQMHTQAIMQNALFKKKVEMEQHEVLKRRLGIHKQQDLDSENINQQHQQHSLNINSSTFQQHSSRHVNSPTPLAFTPTSVLRKMTAEKESTSTSSTQALTSAVSLPQQGQPHLQQTHVKAPTHSQISYQHSNQPRMILGGGNFQYINQHQHQAGPVANDNPEMSSQQKSQIRNQPPGSIKWPHLHPSLELNNSVLGTMSNKPMGRPILKGPGPIQPLVLQNGHNAIGQNLSNVNQNSQTICQMQKYSSVQQQPRQIVGQQFATHIMHHQLHASQQNKMQQQLLQQQHRSVVMHHQQIQQNDLGNNTTLPPPTIHPVCNDNNSVTNLNYQRDGGLSPTSNQLAQWFSPELLARASAGKLPLLNTNQALSLEEFERSIQHSSTAVNNCI